MVDIMSFWSGYHVILWFHQSVCPTSEYECSHGVHGEPDLAAVPTTQHNPRGAARGTAWQCHTHTILC